MPDAPRIDPTWAWQRYRPDRERPWDIKRVGHLYRRAGFGATFAELSEGVRAGVEAAVDGFFSARPSADLDAAWETIKQSVSVTNNGVQLPAVWVYRMLHTPQPLIEKLTLLWHDHFATSNLKVLNAGYMLGQYELMRRNALGNFGTMLQEMSRDPAMLVWLDTVTSPRARPNENYARELMELFSLGIPHPREASRRNYTEADVREAAKAFTGWRIVGGRAVFQRELHDDGEKTVFGRRGRWGAEDVVRFCLEHEACPYFICRKLYDCFISDVTPPAADLLAPLARQLKDGDYELRPVVERMLRSNLFFSEHAYRTKIKSPVEYVLGLVRGLEGHVAETSSSRRMPTTQLTRAMEEMGQRVFYPPSVAGWDGGEAWLNAQTLLLRQNLALGLCSTSDDRYGRRSDAAGLARRHERGTDAERVDLFLSVFLQGDVPEAARTRLLEYAEGSARNRYPVFWSAEDAEDQRVRSLCHLVLCAPEYQLC
jgi:uncharacterized protein (DUF1800 family)